MDLVKWIIKSYAMVALLLDSTITPTLLENIDDATIMMMTIMMAMIMIMINSRGCP